jgi:hypothetical protein
LSSAPLLVAVNSSQKQRMMSRRMIYDVTPLHIGTTSSQDSATSATPTYLFGAYFLCSTRYIEIYAKNGTAPQPADLVSPYNRCILP